MPFSSTGVRWYSLLIVVAIIAAWMAYTTYRDTPEDRVYRIGWEEDPPVQIATASGEPTGLSVEIIREAARRKSIRLQWVHRSESSEAALKSKAVDLWPLMTITEDRKKILHLTEPYQENAHIFLIPATSPARKAQDLALSIISYDRIPFNLRLLRQYFPQASLLPKTSIREAIDAVCLGESDAVFVDRNAGFSILLEGSPCPKREMRMISDLKVETQLAIGATFEARAAADAIRGEIGVMADEGVLARLMSEWSYASSRDLEAISTLLHARRRVQQYRMGFAGLALLLAFAAWSAAGYRRERNRAQASSQALHAAERNLRLITDNLNEMVLAYDMSGKLTYANPGVEKLTGYTSEEIRAKGFICWIHPEDSARMLSYWDKLFEGQSFQQEEYRLIAKDGKEKWSSATWGPIIGESGTQIGVQGSERDITERKTAEQRLSGIAHAVAASVGEEYFRSAVEELARAVEADYVFIAESLPAAHDRVRTVALYAHGQPAANIEYDLVGTPCEKVVRKELCCYPSKVREQFPRTTLLAEMEAEAYVGTPLFDSTGRILGLLAAIFCNSLNDEAFVKAALQIFAARAAAELVRMRAEAEVNRRNRELFLLNQVMAAATADLPPKAVLEVACRELAQAFSLPQAAAVSLNEERTAIVMVAEYAASHSPSELHPAISQDDNSLIQFLTSQKQPIAAEDATTDPRLIVIQRLIQEYKVVSLLTLPLIIEGEAMGGLFLGSTERHRFSDEEIALACIVTNQAARSLELARLSETRRRLTTAIEQTPESIVITDLQGRILYVNPAFERITGYNRSEALGQNPRVLKSGQHDDLFYKELWTKISSGEVWRGRLLNRKKDGSLFSEDAIIAPVRDERGAIANYIAVKRDITRELELEKQLRIAQKHEALGTMAGGIAHDFNNILGGLVGYADLSRMYLAEDHPIYDFVQQILAASDRAKELVQQILTVARQSEQVKTSVDVGPIVKEVIKLIRNVTPATISIEQHLDPKPAVIMADPSQIHQILMNLCANANHAMRERGGVLTIKLNHVTVDEDTARRTGTPKSGEYELLEVVDTGRGMDARTLDRIFDPYFTTKAPGEGTGLGMAVVKGIVESHEGWIGVASEPGKGTTVSVYLPCTQMPKPTASEQSKEDYSGQARVLVVDDESAIMAVETSILQHLGYNVTACLKSTEALQIFLARPDDFDLVVTDQTMPGMTGIQLIKEVHALRPNMPVVLCTGYSDQVSKESAQQHGITEFLSKPLSVSTLGKAVKQALSKRPTPIGKKLQPQRHGDAEQ